MERSRVRNRKMGRWWRVRKGRGSVRRSKRGRVRSGHVETFVVFFITDLQLQLVTVIIIIIIINLTKIEKNIIRHNVTLHSYCFAVLFFSLVSVVKFSSLCSVKKKVFTQNYLPIRLCVNIRLVIITVDNAKGRVIDGGRSSAATKKGQRARQSPRLCELEDFRDEPKIGRDVRVRAKVVVTGRVKGVLVLLSLLLVLSEIEVAVNRVRYSLAVEVPPTTTVHAFRL